MSDRVQKILLSVLGAVVAAVGLALDGYDYTAVLAGDPIAIRKLASVVAVGAGTGLVGWVQTWLNDFSPAQRAMELRVRGYRREAGIPEDGSKE